MTNPAKPQPPAEETSAEATCKHCGCPQSKHVGGEEGGCIACTKCDHYLNEPAAPEPRSEPQEDITAKMLALGIDTDKLPQPSAPPEPPQIPDEDVEMLAGAFQRIKDLVKQTNEQASALAAERTSHDELKQAMRNQGEAVTQYSRHVEELTAELNSRHRLDEFLGIAKDASGAYYNKALVKYQVSHAEELAAERAKVEGLKLQWEYWAQELKTEKSKREAAETALRDVRRLASAGINGYGNRVYDSRNECNIMDTVDSYFTHPPQQTAKPEGQP